MKPITSAYDLTGCYGQDWKQGLLVDHVMEAEHNGFRVVTLTRTRRLVCEDGKTFPVVCGDLIAVRTEDGMIDGRCGLVANLEGACDAHAEERAAFLASTEAERIQWEQNQEAWGTFA